jgi:hypothetical protein
MNPKRKQNVSASKPSKSLQLTIDIRPLKVWVSKNLAKDTPLRDVILSERDNLEILEILAKIETWLSLQSSTLAKRKSELYPSDVVNEKA